MMRSKELQEVARLRSGEDFGERGIIDEDRGNRVRTAHAITTQPCVLATLERQAYVFVTEIMKIKPLIDRFWLVAAEVQDPEVWATARTEEPTTPSARASAIDSGEERTLAVTQSPHF